MMHVNGLSNVPGTRAKSADSNATATKALTMQELYPIVLQEARAVSLWSCVAILFRIVLILLIPLVAYRHDSSALKMIPFLSDSSFTLYKEFWMTISVVCGWILGIAPAKVLNGQAPGFIFANPW